MCWFVSVFFFFFLHNLVLSFFCGLSLSKLIHVSARCPSGGSEGQAQDADAPAAYYSGLPLQRHLWPVAPYLCHFQNTIPRRLCKEPFRLPGVMSPDSSSNTHWRMLKGSSAEATVAAASDVFCHAFLISYLLWGLFFVVVCFVCREQTSQKGSLIMEPRHLLP